METRKRRADDSGFHDNCLKKLKTREISSSKFCRSFNFEDRRFHNFRLQEEYDIYNHQDNLPRSKIINLLAISDLVFALAKSGTCSVFSRETKKRICFLNASPDEEIQSLIYNRENDSLITLSLSASDKWSTLICRSTSIKHIRRGQPDAGFRLFESESIGFVDFDDLNGKVILQCEKEKVYKVFDLKNYTFLYSIIDKNVQGIEISRGIFVLIYKRTQAGVSLKLISVEDGTVIKSFNNLFQKKKKVIFAKIIKDKLIVKQEKENIQIVDVQNSHITEVSRTEILTPRTIVYLCDRFLMFTNQTAMLWNLRGELVTSFEDHLYDNQNVYAVAQKGKFLIAYRKYGNAYGGSINISNMSTGKSVGKITANNARKSAKVGSTLAEALKDITAVFYDGERNEIYTSNKLGSIHVWTN